MPDAGGAPAHAAAVAVAVVEAAQAEGLARAEVPDPARAVADWLISPTDSVGVGLVFLTVVALISERFPEKETQQLIFIKVFWIKN